MNINSNLETTPEKALIASYIIKLLNRNASSKVDRLLKKDYDEVKRNPLILDTILRAQILAFFSKTGSIGITKDLMKYYRDYKLHSALLDAKNMLVICSKQGIDQSDMPFSPSMSTIVLNLIEKEKGFIVKKHVKSALASCILTGNMGENFERLMSGELEEQGLDYDLCEFLKNTCKECKNELKSRIEDSVPVSQRN
jgi:hypothetical protein